MSQWKIIDSNSIRVFNISAIGATISKEKKLRSSAWIIVIVLQTSLQSNSGWLTSWKFFNCWILLLPLIEFLENIFSRKEQDISLRSFEKYKSSGELYRKTRCVFPRKKERNRSSFRISRRVSKAWTKEPTRYIWPGRDLKGEKLIEKKGEDNSLSRPVSGLCSRVCT